jgi:HEAT repeat protein
MRPPRLAVAWSLPLVAVLAACGGSLESDSPARRAAAVRALATRGGDGPVPALLVAQRDPSPLVRRAAAEVLAGRHGPHAAEALGAMLSDPDPGVATAAAKGLARIGDLEPSRRALVDGYALASPAGRAAIADALDELGVSLRDALEAEARRLWARNLTVMANGSPEARAGAIEELGASGRTEAVERIRALLEQPGQDRRIGIAAMRGLGEAGDGTVRPLLEKELAKPDPEYAEAAAWALGRLGDPAATPVLARLAASGSSTLHRAALGALIALPAAPEVSLALCGVAVRSQSPFISARAARAAWSRNADCPAAQLATRAGRGEPPAQEAIAELHPEPTVVGPLAAKLAAIIGDPRASSERRRRAATLLGRLSWSVSAPVVEARARAVLARVVAARAGWIPGRFSEAASLPSDPDARLAFLRDRPSTLPARAADQQPAVAEWIDLTSEDDREELGALLAALGRLQSATAGALLLDCAQDPSPEIRAGAIEGLGFLGGAEPSGEVVAALSDRAERVRTAAVRVVPRYGPRAVPALSAAVERSGEADVRWREALAAALGETGAPEALAPLARLLSGTAAGAAATAIAAIGVADGAAPLLASLGRKETPGRVEVLDALAQLASRSAGPAISDELLSERPDVRMAAARAVGRLRYEPASPRLEALRVDYDGRVRRSAIEALAKLPSGRPRGP